MRVIDRDEVTQRLTYEVCIPLIRDAMIAFSRGDTLQLLRSIIPLGDGDMFGIMPGALAEQDVFGAKLVSVFPKNAHAGGQSHQGVVVLFDRATGSPVCVVHAGEVTAIRTAAASAVATQVLARSDAHRLTILGCGEQARAHIRAVSKVRKLTRVTIWGRDRDRADKLANFIAQETGLSTYSAESAEAAVADADIICTVTSAAEPILFGRWLPPGVHVNLVGSSYAGPTEVDGDLVRRSRFIADSREGVLMQGAEFLRAKEAGLVGDEHIVGEIGQVLTGEIEGRQSAEQITAYKSIGHIVQDLAAAKVLMRTDPL